MNEKELIKSLELFAHKIKNPVHSVVINLDVLNAKLRKQVKDKSTLKHLEIVTSEVRRLNDIIANYLNYLNKSDKDRAKINLRKLLE